MSLRYKGGVISATPPTTTGGTSGTAKGVWTLEQQMQAQAAGLWPSAPPQAVQISRSLRFNSADSAYLNRTPASAGNRKTWTWSAWVKRSSLAVGDFNMFGSAPSGGSYARIGFVSDSIQFENYSGSSLVTTAKYRDPSAWYHIVLVWDTTQSTSSERIKLYVNGVQVTAFTTSSYPTQNIDGVLNNTNQHSISAIAASYLAGYYYDGYMTEINFIDGQALTPSSFGQTNSTTGVWEPIQTVGFLTYGTNGFHLDFDDNSGTTSTTLGKDTSGNSNNWTPNNFSVTAGVGNDSLVDTPTPYGTDTGAGGEVRGNYATLSYIDVNASYPLPIANGALQITAPGTGTYYNGRGTMVPTDKVYMEVNLTGTGTDFFSFGLQDINSAVLGNSYMGVSSSNSIGFGDLGFTNYAIYNNGTYTDSGLTKATTDVIQIAYDPATRKIWFGRNNTWYNSGNPAAGTNATATLTSTITYNFAFTIRGSAAGYVNFGQRAWTYTAPSGFKALVTQNLPAPTVVQGDDYFNTVLWTGNGSTNSITGVGFQPDLVWLKGRSLTSNHRLYDVIRGATKSIYSDLTDAEGTESTGLTSFNTDGFTLGSQGGHNGSGSTYVGWNWKANGAGSSNTAGTISSTVSANTTSGFSIVTYTGTGSSASVGHGLGAAPQMIIVKGRTNTVAWVVYSIGLTPGYEIYLSATNAQASSANFGSAPTSTVFNLGTDTNANGNGVNYVAYCFAPIVGFSAFGKWTGNGSTDGPFIYTGFRPAMIFTKQINTGGENWYLMDNKRSPFNVANDTLYPNLSGAETVDNANVTCDFVSNGFKLRDAYSGWNANGGTYIYAAFAENPFKYSLAR